MTRYLLLIMLFPVIASAQKLGQADIKQLKLYSSGVFSNEVQAKADTHFVNTSLKIKPIWQKRKDGAWLFCEKADTQFNYQVWHFYLQDDSTILLQFFEFKDTAQAGRLSKNIMVQDKLYLNTLSARNGCEVYLKKNKSGYAGTSSGKDCFVKQPGIEYVLIAIEISKNTINWQQTAFDVEDKEVPGFANGNYNFIRQVVKSSK